MRALVFLFATAALVQQPSAHQLKAGPKTVVWGYDSASAPPALRVRSGDTVEIETLITNSPARLEAAGVAPEQIEPSLRAIDKEVTEKDRAAHSHRAGLHRRRRAWRPPRRAQPGGPASPFLFG